MPSVRPPCLPPSSSSSSQSVEVEVVQRAKSRADPDQLRRAVRAAADIPGATLADLRALAHPVIPQAEGGAGDGPCPDPGLSGHVERVDLWVCDEPPAAEDVTLTKECRLLVHVFKLDVEGAQPEEMEPEDGEEGGNGITAAMHWMLPSEELQGVWESLIYEEGLKKSLMNYVETTLLVSDHGIDSNLISWNRIILLHGPPGTGKTSLCRALAHKLAIRLSHRYRYGQLIEVNSHSLFSKWFSESGKLVQRMFEAIQEIVDDPQAFVCVLVDEVESLAAVRKSTGFEPSDAIRVVNAMLTQLDKLKRYPNVLLLTTSNITGSIDLAFVDRADLKKFIGLPCKEAVYKMLRGSAEELMEKKLLTSESCFLPFRALQNSQSKENPADAKEEAASDKGGYAREASEALLKSAEECVGLSGRTIRKLPFLALVKMADQRRDYELPDFLECLKASALEQKEDREKV